MMKVLHCISSLQVGGAEKCVRNLSLEQKSQQLSVGILSFGKPNDAFQSDIEKAGIEVFNINGNVFVRSLRTISVLLKYSTIHIHSPAVIRAFTPLFLLLILKNVIYTIHGEVEPPLKYLKFAHKLSSVYINTIFAVSEPIKRGIKERYGWSEQCVSVVENGVVVPSSFAEIGNKNKLRLCMVCRLIPLKNVSQIIDAFNRHKLFEMFLLDIYGDGPERAKLEDKVERLKLSKYITFHGNQLDENFIYENEDVLLINSTTEGLPMSLVEAMARGIPAVSTNVGNISSVISHGENGYIYEINDMATWKKCLFRLHEDRKLLEEMGKSAHLFISKQFSIKSVSSIYQKFYS